MRPQSQESLRKQLNAILIGNCILGLRTDRHASHGGQCGAVGDVFAVEAASFAKWLLQRQRILPFLG